MCRRDITADKSSQQGSKLSFVDSVRLCTRGIGVVLLLIFLSFYSSSNLFWHTHIVGDQKVVHSHPFENSTHTHTASQLLTIGIWGDTSLDSQQSGIDFSQTLFSAAITLFVAISLSKPLSFSGLNRLFRGPPSEVLTC